MLPNATARSHAFDARLRALPAGLAGRVTSRHAHSAVAELEGGGALVLLAAGRPLVPWGVRLPPGQELPAAGSRLRLEGDRLTLAAPRGGPRDFCLEGSGQDLFVPIAEKTGAEEKGLLEGEGRDQARLAGLWDALPERTRQLLTARPIGRTALRATFAELELARLTSSLGELLACLHSPRLRDPAGAERLAGAVRGLLGLGRGSTPSGDDLLTGAAAAARARGLPGARGLCDALADPPPGATTPTGRAMLREAAAGFFPAPLASIARAWPAPRPSALEALGGLGASSGADMLAGFLALMEGSHA